MNTTPAIILIAEDDVTHSTAISRSLERSFPETVISVVTSLREYHEYISETTPTIAILDLNLNDGTTLDLLVAPADRSSFPIIILTSNGSEKLAAEAIKRGAMDYIVKSSEVFAGMGLTVIGALREWQLMKDKLNIELQLKESQARIIQQEKMASIGQLAAGVAHEINNPMGYITSNMNSLWKYAEKLAQFIEIQEQTIEMCADEATKASIVELKRQIKLDFVMKDFRELITESLEGSKRVSKIVQDLKSFSRAESIDPVSSDLNECIKRTINVVKNEIKYVAELDLQLGDIPLVVCHPQQISQVIMNLLVNAAHAIAEKGVITLVTCHDDTSVNIIIQDTGSGIPPENIEKIFEPFFTTKEAGKGTGLGLAISNDIIRKHGGDLTVNSEVGKGTAFTVRLPINQKGE